MPPSPAALQALADRWSDADARERANAQLYLIELCDALGVERPRPAGSGYEFELPLTLLARDGTESPGFVDLYKRDHFILEAKDAQASGSTDKLLLRAWGQARQYASNDPSGTPPPYLLLLDVAKTMLVWDRWTGTYGGFASAKRIDLGALAGRPDDAALLADIWERPAVRDPRVTAQAVTKEIAARLAQLAASLEQRGQDPDAVALFLMRVCFTCFAEDTGLLPDEPWRRMLQEIALPKPEEFAAAAEELWAAMDEGRRFGFRKLLRFNGAFFRDAKALPLTRDDLGVLLEAARADWSTVEPAIFGTLLTRVLDADERHRLGAEYTPPAFIERVIQPTIEEPVRERWTAVQAEVFQLRESGRAKDRRLAEQRLREFHTWLRSIQILDPAAGSGNFLYVAMRTLKRVEVEVLHELAQLGGGALELRLQEVDPSQFHGIELKRWAQEICELSLWIGYHQFWRQQHGAVQPEEPLLRDTGTLECRDAVLVWDDRRRLAERDRPDPTPRIRHPNTGELVPDPAVRLPYSGYIRPRPAAWPRADFIVGNPPYLGQFRQRDALGDDYVDALRAAYPELPDTADLVCYWWYRAAEEVAARRTIRAGLITTNSITQTQNRTVIAAAATRGARVMWAIPDHVWYEGGDGAEVRVAMTVIAKDPPDARLLHVEKFEKLAGDVPVVSEVRVSRLNADLTAHADVATAVTKPLRANAGLSSPGFKLHGSGFILDAAEADMLLAAHPLSGRIIRPYRNGKDLTARPRGVSLIDFGLVDEAEARAHAAVFDIVRDRVKPERDVNTRAVYKANWWRFGEPRRELRAALSGLARYIATPETSKHRIFTFLSAAVAPDNSIIVVASDDAYVLGILSSTVHVTWALAAGGRMGVRDTPRYNKSTCFEPFAFPTPTREIRDQVATLAERIEQHRADALAASTDVTLMKLYDVIEALRGGQPLSLSQQRLHTLGGCGVLRDLHDELDRAVAAAYGWSWPEPRALVLERLVALHGERREEEERGDVHWLRPSFQIPRFASAAAASALAPELVETENAPLSAPPWPGDAVTQITALRQLTRAAPITLDEAMRAFSAALRAIVLRHLETLAILGEVQLLPDGRYVAAVAAA